MQQVVKLIAHIYISGHSMIEFSRFAGY